MQIRKKVKQIINKLYSPKFKKYVKRKDFTIVANDCTGGILYNRLGRKFLSPFINLSLPFDDYLLLLTNFFEITKLPIIENVEESKRKGIPTGFIVYNNKKININFTHYSSFKDAEEKWNKRVKRIDNDDIYIIFNLTDILDKSVVESYLNKFIDVPFEKKIALTRFDINCTINKKINFKNKKFRTAQLILNSTLFKKPVDQLILDGFFKK